MQPVKILFVCHGNICRSPMAEYVLRHLAQQRGFSQWLTVASAATSTEELGSGVHPGTREVLRAHGVECPPRRAVQLKPADSACYDWLIAMDENNVRNMRHVLGEQAQGGAKVRRLLDFTGQPRDIADPWYTGDFDTTFADIFEGCEALLQVLLQTDET